MSVKLHVVHASIGVALAVVAACGGSTSSSSPTDAGASSSGSSGDASVASDGSSGAPSHAPVGAMAFVVDRVFLGESDRDGVKNKDAWKAYGRNIDGLVTVVTDPKATDLTLVCKRQAGAPATIHADGNAGIDNTWGKEILKLIDPFSPTASKSLTDQIAAGGRTPMLSLNGTTGSWLYAEKMTTPPTFAPTEERAVAAPWMNAGGALATIVGGGIDSNGAYDSGILGGEALIELGPDLTVALRSARIIMTIAPDDSAVTEGTISGVVDTEELVTAFRESAKRLSPDLCAGTTIDGISDAIRQASDIMRDGTQDPAQTCNGISVGVGFTAKRVVVGPVAPAPPAEPDPCQP